MSLAEIEPAQFDAGCEPLEVIALPERGTGERHRRREERLRKRRRVTRQQVIVVLVFALALVVTVLVLGRQWLGSSGTSADSPSSPQAVTHSTGGNP